MRASSDKDAVIPELGCSLRNLLRAQGAALRERLGEDIITRMAILRGERLGAAARERDPGIERVIALIDDVRMPAEYDALRARHATLLRIRRPQVDRAAEDVTDNRLSDRTFDRVIRNEGAHLQLHEQARHVVTHLGPGHRLRPRRAETAGCSVPSLG